MWVITIKNPLADGVGLLGNILSFMVSLAPLPTFYTIYKKKSTESFDSLPYIVALFSAMLWVYYALLTVDVLLMTINTAVIFIESVYLVIYLLYAPSKPKAFTLKLLFMLNVGAYGCLVFFSFVFLKGKKRAEIAGWFGASFAFVVFVAPLNIIKLVIKTKSVQYMPFSLSFFLTLSAVAWFSYGLLRQDMFVALPNVLGFLFGMAQMIVYFIYMNVKTEETKVELSGQAANATPATSAASSVADIEDPEKKEKKSISETPPELSQSESNA